MLYLGDKPIKIGSVMYHGNVKYIFMGHKVVKNKNGENITVLKLHKANKDNNKDK